MRQTAQSSTIFPVTLFCTYREHDMLAKVFASLYRSGLRAYDEHDMLAFFAKVLRAQHDGKNVFFAVPGEDLREVVPYAVRLQSNERHGYSFHLEDVYRPLLYDYCRAIGQLRPFSTQRHLTSGDISVALTSMWSLYVTLLDKVVFKGGIVYVKGGVALFEDESAVDGCLPVDIFKIPAAVGLAPYEDRRILLALP